MGSRPRTTWSAAQNDVFEAMAATTSTTMTLAGAGQTARLRVGRVSPGYFGVFGIRPVLGRAFAPEDETAGRDRVVVLSNPHVQSVFGADRGIVGRAIVLDGQTFTVVGVLPAESSFDRGRTRSGVRSPSGRVSAPATITGCR